MGKRRGVTIMVHPDGALESRTYWAPLWLVRLAGYGAVVFGVLILVAAILFTPIVQMAARVPGMQTEIERLREENRQVHELSLAVEQLEAAYEQVRTMFGAVMLPQNPVASPVLPVATPIFAAAPGAPPRYDAAQVIPLHWPLDRLGFVTRGFGSDGEGSEVHPGLDIAVSLETPIRASASGMVGEAGVDPEYGRYVLIDHSQGYQTMYGHASRTLVQQGDSVLAGQVIGLTGSTGRSTAPHLHFEVRLNGRSLDPTRLIREAVQ